MCVCVCICVCVFKCMYQPEECQSSRNAENGFLTDRVDNLSIDICFLYSLCTRNIHMSMSMHMCLFVHACQNVLDQLARYAPSHMRGYGFETLWTRSNERIIELGTIALTYVCACACTHEKAGL